MASPVNGVNVISEAEHVFRVGIVVLQCHFNRQFPAIREFAGALKVDRLIVQYRLAAVQVFYELSDTAAVIELLRADIFAALIRKRDL